MAEPSSGLAREWQDIISPSTLSSSMTPAQLYHQATRFRKVLELVLKSGRTTSTEDLICYAEQDHQVDASTPQISSGENSNG